MSDQAQELCPTCVPGTDPTRSLVVVTYCPEHRPDCSGPDDVLANPLAATGPELSEGGVDGAAWCHLLHREART